MKLKELKRRIMRKAKPFYKDPLYQSGRIFEEARISRGWTQKELAKRLKTQQPNIARWENAKSHAASLKHLQALCDATGFPFVIHSSRRRKSNMPKKKAFKAVKAWAVVEGGSWKNWLINHSRQFLVYETKEIARRHRTFRTSEIRRVEIRVID